MLGLVISGSDRILFPMGQLSFYPVHTYNTLWLSYHFLSSLAISFPVWNNLKLNKIFLNNYKKVMIILSFWSLSFEEGLKAPPRQTVLL
jgi:hypothetical protein